MKAVTLVGVLLVVAIILGIYYETEIIAFSKELVAKTGLFGIVLIIYLIDIIVSPLPPDLFLFVISKNGDPFFQFSFVLLLGCVSSIAGCTAWFLGKRLLKPHWFGPRAQYFVRENHNLINRYGRWAVGIAALTPVPFSIVSWATGFFKMDFKDYFLMSLLRIPRFLGFFYLIVFSGQVSSWIRHLLGLS